MMNCFLFKIKSFLQKFEKYFWGELDFLKQESLERGLRYDLDVVLVNDSVEVNILILPSKIRRLNLYY